MSATVRGRRPSTKAHTKTARIEARATADEASVIARAASLLNATMSSFVVDAAVEKAQAVVLRASQTIMPAAQYDDMIHSLDDATPVPELAELASRPRLIGR